MATSSCSPAESSTTQHLPSPAAAVAAANEDDMGDIPRRPMRVKVLYTFDDQNKSNCLARLPNAVSVPVVSLDETTQVGVIELKTCIQAIVAASPELVAKLGHDYTVYAYDFSEYETPLVGQGMLSWILASASPTPNAPAEDSRTMVTGRVCKNILGIFSNGVKETLEVKLKLVPVPTCMQKEYVENMERYHSLSQLMPEGFDYNAWADFMKENPTLGHLAQPVPQSANHTSRGSFGGVEPFHQMLTRQSPSQEPARNDSYYDPTVSFNSYPTRASSPAMSTLSFHHYQYNHDSRPASRTSVRSEVAPPCQPQQFPFSDPFVVEAQEEGPPKKRARITEAKRPKHTPLLARNDSLRVTASSAASVRLHKPILNTSAASADLVPRVPTPRPGDKTFGQRGQRRPPAPSALRHASIDEGRPYMSPYENTSFSDAAGDSPEDRNGSPDEIAMDIPSSPPVAPQRTASPAPSSPNLPMFPLPADSGFVSDVSFGRDDDGMAFGSDVPAELETRTGPRQNKVRRDWQHVNPGPVEHLPQSYMPRPKQHYRKYPVQPIAESIEHDEQMTDITNTQQTDKISTNHSAQHSNSRGGNTGAPLATTHHGQTRANGRPIPIDSFPFGPITHDTLNTSAQTKHESPETTLSQISPLAEGEAQVYSRSTTPNLLSKQTRPTKTRGLPRSHTWSGAGEPMSDAPGPSDSAAPRSGSGAKRKKYIKEKLEKALAAGEMPTHCVNCGEIDTPTWRKAYTRVEMGSPEGLEVSANTAGTDIIAFEIIEPSDENDKEQKYRVFKNNVTQEEKAMNIFQPLNLCNPCGLWLIKKASMRPQKQWDKSARQLKRKRAQGTDSRSKSLSQGDDLASDAAVPMSDTDMIGESLESQAPAHSSTSGSMHPPPTLERATTAQGTTAMSELDAEAAAAAFRRAIQSSPAGLRGSQASPINIDPDLTPNPTRRLLFPSPRKDGEVKSLAEDTAAVANKAGDDEAPLKPRCERCKRLRKACDRERPCKRCENADIGFDGCIPCEMPKTNYFQQPSAQAKAVINEEENPDKENCPPTAAQEHDDFADLFEDPVSPKTTPQKIAPFQDLLKTPTPGSRHRAPLTPRCTLDDNDSLRTPSRNIFTPQMTTPRSNRAATIAPETPFTRQLNALLSDHPIASPHNIDFTSFPTFTTPGRNGVQFADFLNDDFLSSDMPMPSSPPKNGNLGLGFALYEDPNTASMGLWAGASMFDSDALMTDMGNNHHDGVEAAHLLKMNVGGVTVDFAAMIEEVVTDVNDHGDADGQSAVQSPKEVSVVAGATPEEQTMI
ncbi:hypothetical protein ACN47E_004334 [Coniothyrium glycines]